MDDLRITAFVFNPEGQMVTPERLKAEPGALAGHVIDLDTDPAGGVVVGDSLETIVVDDSLPDAVGFFFDDLPEMLRAGESTGYRFRSAPVSLSVEIAGGSATLNYDGRRIEASIPVLLEALDAGRRGYEELLRAAGQP